MFLVIASGGGCEEKVIQAQPRRFSPPNPVAPRIYNIRTGVAKRKLWHPTFGIDNWLPWPLTDKSASPLIGRALDTAVFEGYLLRVFTTLDLHTRLGAERTDPQPLDRQRRWTYDRRNHKQAGCDR